MIKRVEIQNVKSTAMGSYDTGKLNFLTGRNGVGKSTIMDAIAVAIEGKHPRNGSKLSDIMDMCPTNYLKVSVDVSKGEAFSTFAREFRSDKGKNSQKIYVNSRKVKQFEGEQKIDNWFGKFLPRVNIHKFIEMSSKDKGKFLFSLFGDKLGALTTEDISHQILYSVIKDEEDFQGVLKFELKKTEEQLTEAESTKLFNETVNKLQARPWAYKHYGIVKGAIDSVDRKQDVQSYINEVVDTIRRAANNAHKIILNTEGAVKKLNMKVDSDMNVNVVKNKIDKESRTLTSMEKKTTDYAKSKQSYDMAVLAQSAAKKVIDETIPKTAIDVENEIKNIDQSILNLNAELKLTQKILQDRKLNKLIEDAELRLIEYPIYDNGLASEDIIHVNNCDDVVAKIAKLDGKIKWAKNRAAILRERIRSSNSRSKELDHNDICPLCHGNIDKDMVAKLAQSTKDDNAELRTVNGKLATQITDRKELLKKQALLYRKITEIESLLGKSLRDKKKDLLFLKENKVVDALLIPRDIKIIVDEISANNYKKATLVVKSQTITTNNEKIVAYNKVILPKCLIDPEIDETEITSVKKKLVELQASLVEASENEGLSKAIEDFTEEIGDYTIQWQYIKKATETAEAVKITLIDSMLGQVNEIANKILGPILDDAEAILTPEFCGIRSKDVNKDVSVLSGGEAVLFSSAILAALMLESKVEEKILMLEAGELDNENLILLLKSLVSVDIDNVFIATFPRGIEDQIPCEWNIIDL